MAYRISWALAIFMHTRVLISITTCLDVYIEVLNSLTLTIIIIWQQVNLGARLRRAAQHDETLSVIDRLQYNRSVWRSNCHFESERQPTTLHTLYHFRRCAGQDSKWRLCFFPWRPLHDWKGLLSCSILELAAQTPLKYIRSRVSMNDAK